MNPKDYRMGVVAVLINDKNQVALFRRTGKDIWQFPQGGQDPGETPEETLYREVLEETGCGDFDIIKSCDETVSYDFPDDMKAPIAQHYCGQKQYWFLCKYHSGKEPDLSRATDKEFDQWKWGEVDQLIEQTIYWKKSAYKAGLKLLGL